MATEIPTTDRFGFPAVPCSRCMGQGGMEHYGHVDGGKCFQCHGEKVVVVDKKAKAAKAAFLSARVRLVTIADLVEGDTFTTGGHNSITRWSKFIGIEADKSELNTSNGYIIVRTNKGSVGTKLDYPARVYVPTDVQQYLAGL